MLGRTFAASMSYRSLKLCFLFMWRSLLCSDARYRGEGSSLKASTTRVGERARGSGPGNERRIPPLRKVALESFAFPAALFEFSR
jgi:hypothetical protein